MQITTHELLNHINYYIATFEQDIQECKYYGLNDYDIPPIKEWLENKLAGMVQLRDHLNDYVAAYEESC